MTYRTYSHLIPFKIVLRKHLESICFRSGFDTSLKEIVLITLALVSMCRCGIWWGRKAVVNLISRLSNRKFCAIQLTAKGGGEDRANHDIWGTGDCKTLVNIQPEYPGDMSKGFCDAYDHLPV